ncbi:MAG TPA: tetratricopeptide repeat protein [Planctomycetota bacterium]|nr:tetratricopeptide repeat protein [Planctomycetota bacterium]
MPVTLHCQNGSRAGQTFTFTEQVITIGRSASCMLVFTTEKSVSRNHCELYFYEGQLAVRDLGSSNGTYINGVRISVPTMLPPGSILKIGDHGPELRVGDGQDDGADATLMTASPPVISYSPAAPSAHARHSDAAGAQSQGSSSPVRTTVPVVLVLVLLAGGGWFGYQKYVEAQICEEVTFAIRRGETGKRRHGEELDEVLAAVEAVLQKHAEQKSVDLQPLRELFQRLKARKELLRDRANRFANLLTDADKLTRGKPSEALEKIAKAEELGQADAITYLPDLNAGANPSVEFRRALARRVAEEHARRKEDFETLLKAAQAALSAQMPDKALEKLEEAERIGSADSAKEYPDLLQGLSPQIGVLKDEARTWKAFQDYLRIVDLARQQQDWDAVLTNLKPALALPGIEKHPRRTEALELNRSARRIVDDFKLKLELAEQFLATGRFEQAETAFKEAEKVWVLSPQRTRIREAILKAQEGIREARISAAKEAGERALAAKDYKAAEEAFTRGLAQDKDAYALIEGLKKVKMGKARELQDEAEELQAKNKTAEDWNRTAAKYAEAAKLSAELGDKRNQAVNINNQAFCTDPERNPGGDLKRAIELYEQSLALHRQVNDPRELAVTLSNLGACLLKPGTWDKSLEYYREAEALAKKSGNEKTLAISLANIGLCLQPGNATGGDWSRAIDHYERAVPIMAKLGDKKSLAIVLKSVGYCWLPDKSWAGNWAKAVASFEEAVRYARESNQTKTLFQALKSLAFCQRPNNNPAGNWAKAIALYNEAIEIATQLGENEELVSLQHALAQCHIPKSNPGGSWERALALYEKAYDMAVKHGSAPTQARIASEWGTSLQPDENPGGNWARALALHELAVKLYTHAGDNLNLANAHYDRGTCLRMDKNPSGDWFRAAQAFEEAARLYANAKFKREEGLSYNRQAFCMIKGDSVNLTPEARALFLRAGKLLREAGDEKSAENSESWAKLN